MELRTEWLLAEHLRERGALEAAAGDMTLSAYVRRLILRHLARRKKQPPMREPARSRPNPTSTKSRPCRQRGPRRP